MISVISDWVLATVRAAGLASGEFPFELVMCFLHGLAAVPRLARL